MDEVLAKVSTLFVGKYESENANQGLYALAIRLLVQAVESGEFMHHSFRYSLFAAFAMLAQVAQAEAVDISGIAIGMPLTTGRSLIPKINPAYQVEDLRFTDGKILGLKAVAKQNGAYALNDQLVIMSNAAGAIWFVARQQDYMKGNRIPLNELESALVQKYGESTRETKVMVLGRRWELDKDGHTHRDKHSPGPSPPALWHMTGTLFQERKSAFCKILLLSAEH